MNNLLNVGNFRSLASIWLLLVIAATSFASAQPAPASSSTSPNTAQIVDHLVRQNKWRADLLKHYQGCRYYTLDYSGFPANKSADMLVDATYEAPADKQFRIVREGGSKLLLTRVLKELLQKEKESLDADNRRQTALSPDNYDFQFIGADTFHGRPQYVLELTPRSSNKFLYRGKIWVDTADFAVSRISAEPAKNPSFWISHTQIEHEYRKIGEFWLPGQNTSITKVRFGGSAKLNIDYLNYYVGDAKVPGGDVCADAPHTVEASDSRQ